MKILIIGGSGMIGYGLLKQYHAAGLDVAATVRQPESHYEQANLDISTYQFFDSIDARYMDGLQKVFKTYQPEYVINATRYKAGNDAYSYSDDVELTALFPLKLSQLCDVHNAHLVHISTNCVFSGDKKQPYVEEDIPDALDLYGKCKSIAEGINPDYTVLRTSIIGCEYYHPRNLLHWFLTQEKEVTGFTRALFNGLTVTELGREILILLRAKCPINGIWHLASNTISKFDTLSTLAKKLEFDIRINADHGDKHSALLNHNKFSETFNYVAPSWDTMLTELAEEIHASSLVETH